MKALLKLFLLLATVNVFAGQNANTPTKSTPYVGADKLSGYDSEDIGGTLNVPRNKNFTLDGIKQYTTGNDVKVISVISELGTPVGGFYELLEDVDYRFDCGLVWDFPVKLTKQDGNYTLSGNNINCIQSYNGVESMIQTANTGIVLHIKNLVLNSPNAETITFTDGNSLILTDIALGFGCQKVATVTDTNFLTCDGFAMVGCDDGITANNVNSLVIDNTQWSSGNDVGGTAFELNGTTTQATFSLINYTAETTESMIDIDNAFTGTVNISNGSFISNGGVFFDPTGKDGKDTGVDIQNVARMGDSGISCLSYSHENTLVTSIGSSDTPVKVNAVWSTDTLTQQRITVESNGRWTYTGLEPTSLTVNASLVVDPATGTRNMSGYVYKNGVQRVPSRGHVETSNAVPCVIFDIVPMETGDYIEFFIENNEGSQNITAEFCTMKLG